MKTETKAVVVAQEQAVAPSGEPSLALILQEAARSGNIEVLERVTALYERHERWSAEKAFFADKAALHAELPQIERSGVVKVESQRTGRTFETRYARYEDIDAILRPLLKKYGFSIEFDSEPAQGGIIVIGRLTHHLGHSETKRTPVLPIDTSGAKNPVQAVGSTVSYGKRYLIGMMLNLVTREEDDDGNQGASQTLTQEQADDIMGLLKALEETGAKINRPKFLEVYGGCASVAEMPRNKYPQARDYLSRKIAEASK